MNFRTAFQCVLPVILIASSLGEKTKRCRGKKWSWIVFFFCSGVVVWTGASTMCKHTSIALSWPDVKIDSRASALSHLHRCVPWLTFPPQLEARLLRSNAARRRRTLRGELVRFCVCACARASHPRHSRPLPHLSAVWGFPFSTRVTWLQTWVWSPAFLAWLFLSLSLSLLFLSLAGSLSPSLLPSCSLVHTCPCLDQTHTHTHTVNW